MPPAVAPDVSSLVAAGGISGAMVAALPVEGSVPQVTPDVGLAHVTLVYLGDDGLAVEQSTRDAIAEILTEAAASHPPITATVAGVTLIGTDGAVALLLNSGDLCGAHDVLQDVLEETGLAPAWSHDGFLPHATVGYGVDPAAPELLALIGTEITFDRLSAVYAEVQTDFLLTGSVVDQVADEIDEEFTAVTAGAFVPRNQEAPMSDPTAAAAPATGADILLSVEVPAGIITLPFVTVDAVPEDADVAAIVASYAGATQGFPVSVAVADTGDVSVTGDQLGSARDALVQALTDAGFTAGYDGDPGTVAGVLDGIDATASGDGTAESLVAPDGTVTDFAGDETGPDEGNEPVAQPDTGMAAEEVAQYDVTPEGAWQGVLVVEGSPSGDRRFIEENALTWRPLPLPLMCMFRNADGGQGHAGAELCGRIDWIERRGAEIWGGGVLDLGSTAGQEAHRLMSEGFMRGVSVDMGAMEIRWENELGDDADIEEMLGFDPGLMIVVAAVLLGATLCSHPAFQEASVHLVDDNEDVALAAAAGVGVQGFAWTPWHEDALVASAGLSALVDVPDRPPALWLARPTAEELADLRASGRAWRVQDDGRFFGFAAIYGALHIGMRKPTHVPRSKSGYAFFMTGEVHCDDGTVVATGPIVMDCVHPDLRMKASDAASFYHHTGAAIGDAVAWDDDDAGGIVIAGALRPGVTQSQLRVLRASDGVSPDWRRIGGVRECVAMLVVNNSGFKNALVAAGGDLEEKAGDYVLPGTFAVHMVLGDDEPLAMVAAGSFAARRPGDQSGLIALATQMASMRRELKELREHVTPLRKERALAQLAEITAN